MALRSSLFSISPEFRQSGRKLIVRTARAARMMSLGLIDRTMTVDPDKQRIRIRDRELWFGRRVEVYPFDLITGVSFHLHDSLGSGGTTFGRDGVEAYSVGLKLYGMPPTDVHLFRFVGEGQFRNEGPLPDWVYWYQSLTDVAGTQEEDARPFVTVLARVLNKPVVPR